MAKVQHILIIINQLFIYMHIDYSDKSLSSKVEKYEYVLAVAQQFMDGETNTVATTANIVALLKQTFGWFWIGFYWVANPDELVLGPFQGTLACTRIPYGKGVCGTAWQTQESQLVPNVHLFPGHIACSADSQSEVVVPIMSMDRQVLGVLDIDSNVLNDFDKVDVYFLEKLCQEIGQYLNRVSNI